MKRTFCLLLFSFSFTGCTPDSDRLPDVSGIAMPVQIRRLEREIFGLRSRGEVTSFLNANPLFAENFLQRSAAPNDSVVVNQLYRMVTDEHLDTLYRQTQTVFADLKGLEAEFADAFRHVKHYYPAFRAPQIHTLVTGFGSDLFVSDSLIVVGLDYYLGERGKYRPNVPMYLQRRYRPEYLVPSSVTLLSQSYNATDARNKSLLAEMIFYGKAYEFTKAMLPNAPDSLIIGYTGKQLIDTETNQAVVWAHFVEKKLLYETANARKIKYTGERPHTPEISSDCPGTIGRWLGWKIVREYRKRHPDVTLPNLMKNSDAQAIFTQSKYKGK